MKITKLFIIRFLLFGGTIVSLFFVPWLLVRAWIMPLPDSIQEVLDEGINYGLDGMIVYVDQGGNPPEFYAAGWKDRDEKLPADPHSLFKIASINKLYDAVSITKLVGRGQLSLDGTVADYFPELVDQIAYADEITLRMLIGHRSGIPNYTDTPDYWTRPSTNYEEALDLIKDVPPLFKPDEDYAYCNTNYLLLGKLIEKTTGKNTFGFFRENILNPLNLKNTYASVNDVNLDDVMGGYHKGYQPNLKANDQGMLATAEDVGIFLRALNDGSIFEDDEQEIYASIYEFNHSGWVLGYQSFAEYHADIDTVVILFNNTTDNDLLLWNLSEILNGRILKILKNRS
ncbi:serine hydrolase domain-containing protein [Winogradskyella aurantiaca]|uniref:serine hydrolase domain-containing protein n=1 Tax=Winogradskyella aurantiaca TaxID=2219558 RepID=UPI000E1D0884|nr:serine hydrolase domain-containing protein [Winogradskyella aurantiaca]